MTTIYVVRALHKYSKYSDQDYILPIFNTNRSFLQKLQVNDI